MSKEYIVPLSEDEAFYGYKGMTVELIRCKDCKHQRKAHREDRRRKDPVYFVYWCDLVDGYAPLGFDDEYCAWAERKEE